MQTEADYESFKKRHAQHRVGRKDLKSAKGAAFLGIDAGSTTTKAALTDADGDLLYTFYKNNEGNPVETSRQMLRELYSLMPDDLHIAYCVTTGYGEGLIKAAFKAPTTAK